MSPAYKYTAGRFVLFAAVFALLLPLPLNILVKAMIALIASAAFSYFLLAKWRNEMAEQIGTAVSRRQQEKTRLRAALAGDEEAAAEGDRAAQPGPSAQPDRVDELDRAVEGSGPADGDRAAEKRQ